MLVAGIKSSYAQLTIDVSQTPAQLVQNVLLGSGITASNITFTGNPLAVAAFSGPSNMGIPSGVILTSGNASLCAGAGSTFASLNNLLPGDSDLDQYDAMGVGSHDATIIEFDFVPTSDSLKFRYVFGSEEYPNFAPPISSSGFNDVFAFFISGPGIAGEQNIALVPGTSQPVAIYTVNPVSNTQYYNDNQAGATIAYNAFTDVFTAQALVQCGQTYHIKLAIQDLLDGSYDSGVFLEAGSFSSVGNVELLPDVTYSNTNDTLMYEGCGDALVYFVRDLNLAQPLNITYTVTGQATNGVDFNNLSGQVTIPAGDTAASITITPIADGTLEGMETITISAIISVCMSADTFTTTLYLQDPIPLDVDAGLDQSTACTGGSQINLNALANGGMAPVSYQWSTGEQTPGISVLPANTTDYIITTTDLCGTQAFDTVTVVVDPPLPLTMTLPPDFTLCPDEIVDLTPDMQGGNGTIDIQWDNGVTTLNQQVQPLATTTYTLTVTDDCGQTATDDVTITTGPVNAAFDWMFLAMDEISLGNQSVGYDNLVWWDFGDGETSTDFEPRHTYADPGTYIITLVVQNSVGCYDTIQHSIIIQSDFYFYIPNSFTPNKDGINEEFNGKGQGFDVYSMSIFNRWGQQIFSTNTLNNGWNGLDHNGNEVPMDVYTYVVKIKITDDQDEHIVYRGIVAVVQ